jgi:dihydroxyacetone kinase-like protein
MSLPMPARRQFLNDPGTIVAQALEGLERAHAGIVRWNRDPSFVIRADDDGRERVAVISGGGSGHEPLHTGFVGRGMLDAAVPGGIFASPSMLQIHAATMAASHGAGVVHVVKNYTGDVINFGLARDDAQDEGVAVETVLVADDLATDAETDGPGRRGTAAVIAVEKICGAAAERGDSLERVAALGREVAEGSRSLAVALEACTHPGADGPSFELAAGEIEFGVGIHGERGIERRPYATARELGQALVEPIAAALGLRAGDRVIAIVNGLGSTHGLELSLMFLEVDDALREAGVEVARSLVGPYVTSLDMAGCSVTLTRASDEILELWDAPVLTPALRW